MAEYHLKELRRLYRKTFSATITLDHLTPKSRNGSWKDEFNIFPFEQSRHQDWHSLFLNMTLLEVWEWLEQTHSLIFYSRRKKICPVWLSACHLERGSSKKTTAFELKKNDLLVTLTDVYFLQKKWINALGSANIATSINFLKYKMLFMIFGIKMTDRKFLLVDDNFIKMIQESANYPLRAQAVINCFGSEMPLLPKARAIFNEIVFSVNKKQSACPR